MSTDAPPQLSAAPDGSPREVPRPRRPGSLAWTVAVIAGVTAVVGALLLPFAPIAVSTPEVSWPLDPRDPAPTMLMLTAYEPADLEVRFSCRTARAAAATPDGVVLSTMGPTSPDTAAEALTVVARGDAIDIRSGGFALFAGPLPPGECRFVVAGDAAAMRVALDGTVVSTTPTRAPVPAPVERHGDGRPDVLPDSRPEAEPVTPLPEVDLLRTSVPATPDATAEDLSVRMTLEDAFDHTPAPSKSVLISVVVVALVVGAVAVPAGRAGSPWRARGYAGLGRWVRYRLARALRPLLTLRPRVVDVVVSGVLLAWLFLAPITDDDGYYSAMAANVPFSGYVTNYYQLYDQGFTPFSWPYYALSWWQTTAGVAPVVLGIPALVLGLGTWFLARAFVARTPLGSGRWVPSLARTALAAAFLAWFTAYDMGVRPEPVVAFFTVAALVAVAEGLERRRLALLGLGVGLASAGLMAAPTGFVALAPLVAAAPVTWRLVRKRATGWWSAAGCWVVILAPVAVGSLLGFADGAYRDFARSQEIFAPIQRAQTWYEEVVRYSVLLDTTSHHGSYARRTVVLVCLMALVWFVVLSVAARARDLVVPARLPLAGWSTLLALVLLLPTPSKPTHHFGALAGLGAVFLALVLVIGPRLLAALDRERRVPQPALVGVALATVLVAALAGHGRAMWPYEWGLGRPAFGDYPSVRGIEFDQPLWWALGLAVLTAGALLVAHLRAPHRRRLALGVSVPALVVALLAVTTGWTVGDFARAATRTSTTWSPQADALADPSASRCGVGGQIDVLDPRDARGLVPAAPSGASVAALDDPDAPAPERRTEPFLPGAFFPAEPPPPDIPVAVPVWGSFLVPEPGANADARTGAFTTDWFRLPPSSGETGLAVAVSGRTRGDVGLRVEYGRRTAEGFVPVGGAPLGAQDRESIAWRTVPLLDEAAPPPGADAVRLAARDDSTTTGGWLAFTAPTERRWVPLPEFLPADAAVGIAWQIRSQFPCLRQPRKQAGITEPAVAAIGYGPTLERALDDWTFDPDRGGLLGHAEREGPGTLLTTRVREVGDQVDDVYVIDLTPPYPDGGYALTRERHTVSGMPEEGIDLGP